MARQPFFTQRFEHAIDKQRRVALPASWRWTREDGDPQDLDETYVLMPSGRCTIHALPKALFNEKFAGPALSALNILDDEQMAQFANLGSRLAETSLDKQGRLMLPEELIESALLEGPKVMLLGGVFFFTIMSPYEFKRLGVTAQMPNLKDLFRPQATGV